MSSDCPDNRICISVPGTDYSINPFPQLIQSRLGRVPEAEPVVPTAIYSTVLITLH